jgi:hypothetical protein
MYFKIINENDQNQSGFKFKTGLNILDDEFLKSKGLISSDILHFTTLKNIHHLYNTGCWIRHVIVPNDAKIIKGHIETHLQTNKIIMGDRFPLYSLKTIKKFNLKITDFYIAQVCRKGKVDILEWWKNSGLELKYSEFALFWASFKGKIEVLEWWKNSGLELKYNESALDWASTYGKVEVLKWWKNSGLELKYTEDAFDWASRNGEAEVLEWWKNSGLEIKTH